MSREEGGKGSKQTVGLCGLPNLGNTCYLNASVQALMHTEPFCSYFLECESYLPPKEAQPGKSQANRRLVHSVSDLVHQFWVQGPKTASPHNFMRDTLDLNPDFRGYGQQDSQEFLRRTLDFLHEELQLEYGRISGHHNAIGSDEDAGGGEGAAAATAAGAEKRDEKKPHVPVDKSSIVVDVFGGRTMSEVSVMLSESKPTIPFPPISLRLPLNPASPYPR